MYWEMAIPCKITFELSWHASNACIWRRSGFCPEGLFLPIGKEIEVDWRVRILVEGRGRGHQMGGW